jgi:hypothetical protein
MESITKLCRLYASAEISDDKFKIAIIATFAVANSSDLFAFATQMMAAALPAHETKEDKL